MEYSVFLGLLENENMTTPRPVNGNSTQNDIDVKNAAIPAIAAAANDIFTDHLINGIITATAMMKMIPIKTHSNKESENLSKSGIDLKKSMTANLNDANLISAESIKDCRRSIIFPPLAQLLGLIHQPVKGHAFFLLKMSAMKSIR